MNFSNYKTVVIFSQIKSTDLFSIAAISMTMFLIKISYEANVGTI
jgi:hypothetical protein